MLFPLCFSVAFKLGISNTEGVCCENSECRSDLLTLAFRANILRQSCICIYHFTVVEYICKNRFLHGVG